MRDLIILASGGLLMYLWLKKNNGELLPNGIDNPIDSSYIKSGEKSKDIENMQKLFEKISGVKFENYGAYDSDTQAVAEYLLSGTDVYSENGVNKGFAMNLSKIYDNSLNK